MEPGKIVVCAGVFCWLLVKKLISQKALLCVVVCVNENWVALLFQDGLVCEVQGLAAWDYLSLVFEVLGPRARLEKVLSRLFLGALARADRGAIKQHNEKLAGHFQQTQSKLQATKTR